MHFIFKVHNVHFKLASSISGQEYNDDCVLAKINFSLMNLVTKEPCLYNCSRHQKFKDL